MHALPEWELFPKIRCITILQDSFANTNIAILEMLNILIALRVWAQLWENTFILIHCDNQGVVDAVAAFPPTVL